MRAGDGLLGLHDFETVSDTGSEPILGLGKRLFSKVDGASGDDNLFGSGIQIQQSGAHFVINASPEIVELGTSLLELSVSLEHVGVHAVACEDRYIQRTGHLPGSIGGSRVYTDVAVVGSHVDGRNVSRGG